MDVDRRPWSDELHSVVQVAEPLLPYFGDVCSGELGARETNASLWVVHGAEEASWAQNLLETRLFLVRAGAISDSH